MASARKIALGRLFAFICGGVVVWHLPCAQLNFFAIKAPPQSPPSSATPTVGGVQDSERSEQAAGRGMALKDSTHHLKLAVQPTMFNRYSGIRMADLAKQTQTIIRSARVGEYYPFSAMPRRIVLICGWNRQHVLDALTAILHSESENILTFLIPKSATGQLIGVGGDKLKAFTAKSGALLQFRNAGLEAAIDVRAPSLESAMAVAEYILDEEPEFLDDMRALLTADYGGNIRGMQRDCTVYLPMSDSQVAQMIGKNGENVKRLTADFFVEIQNRREIRDEDDNLVVKISGKVGDVQACHLHLLNRFAYAPDGDASD